MTQPTIPQAFQLAVQHHQASRLQQAESIYRQILQQQPNHPETLHALGALAHQTGHNDSAVDLIRRAIALIPHWPEAYYNLGGALKSAGKLDEAIASYRQAIALRPTYAEAYANLGNVLKDKGQLKDAIATYRQAIALQPAYAEAYVNLGVALKDQGQLDDAITAYRQAIALKPSLYQAHNNLGNALKHKEQLDEAITAFRQAIALKPDIAEAYSNLGNVLKDKGQLDDAIAAFRQAIALKPNFVEAHSNLLFALTYHPDSTPQQLLQESLRWGTLHAEPLKKYIQPHTNDRNPHRRLRVGYVSPDLRDHVAGRALLPLLASHNHHAFEIFCYAQVPVPDAMTQRLRSHADTWRSIVGLSDQQVADLVRQDQIDILIDLSGHSRHHRLLVFARKPAPVQVTWLGYPGTTGFTAMDYRITTTTMEPHGQSDGWYCEQSIRLPETAWCYQPNGSPPNVVPPPALTTGRVTFGCLNNLCKATPPTLLTWIELLRAVPASDLLLYAPEGDHRQRMRNLLASAGIDSQRVRFVGWGGSNYFELYQHIDISLDPWPFTGSTTTCDSLWMGVPVVTRIGPRAVSRLSLAVLSNVGLLELVAHTPQQYVQIATELAHNLPRLAELRSTLRQRLQASPIMDAPRFARNMEAAYRAIWRAACASNS